jgi:ABC-2 type transport system ATP-binding protein
MIEINHLTKYYGQQAAVNDISFKVDRGEIVGFLGPNGAGKSTTMKIITCFMPPSGGEVTVDGMSVEEHSLEVRKMIGYLPELNPLYLDMNVIDFLDYVGALRSIDSSIRMSRIREIIDICALGEVLHKNIGQLSKGYKQRVGLGQAMIHDPEILILDEPTIGLDPNQVVDIRNLIRQLGREKTVILSTHILSEVQATCDRAVIINRGSIVADSSIADLQRDASNQDVIDIEVSGESNNVSQSLSALDGVSEVREIYPDGTKDKCFRIIAEAGADPRKEIFQAAVSGGWVLVGMNRQVHSLEEVFHKLTLGN